MLSLRSCEKKLIERLRQKAVPYGTLEVAVQVEYQDGVPVMVRLKEQVAIQEEKLR